MSKYFNKIPARFILFSCISLLLIIFSISHFYIVSYYKGLKLEAFVDTQQKAFTIFEDKLNSFVYGLQGISGVFRAIDFKFSPVVMADYAISRDYFKNFEGSLGFGVIRNVPSTESYLREVRKLSKDFEIKRIGEIKEKNFIIEIIEPMYRNKAAVGLNIASEQVRYEAAIQAIEKRSPTITSEIKLVQDSEKKAGYLIFLPIFKNPDLKSHKNEFVGFAYSPILASSAFEYLEKRINIDFKLEISQKGSSDYFYNDLKTKEPLFVASKVILGKTWTWRSFKDFSLELRIISLTSLGAHLFLFIIVIFSIYKYLKSLEIFDVEVEKNIKLESWLSAILNSTELSIISTDQNGIIKTFNSGAEKLLGYDGLAVINKLTPAFIHDLDEIASRAQSLSHELNETVEAGFDVFIKKTKSGKTDINEWTYIDSNSQRIPVRLSVSSVIMGDEVIGYVGIAEDLRQIRKLNELIELQKMQIMEKSRLSSLGEMASGVAHEINNPLTAINSQVSLIQKKIERNQISINEISIDLKKVNELTLRVSKIILGLRSLARDSSEDPFIDFEIARVVNDALSICNERFSQNDISIKLDVDENIIVKMIPTQISQVVLNLLINSFDAIIDSKNKWVSIKIEKNDNKAFIIIVDSGFGILEEIVNKIMNPFFTTKELGKGTGLGLSVSQAIVEKHKGRLFYRLHNNINTSFVIELPISND